MLKNLNKFQKIEKKTTASKTHFGFSNRLKYAPFQCYGHLKSQKRNTQKDAMENPLFQSYVKPFTFEKKKSLANGLDSASEKVSKTCTMSKSETNFLMVQVEDFCTL